MHDVEVLVEAAAVAETVLGEEFGVIFAKDRLFGPLMVFVVPVNPGLPVSFSVANDVISSSNSQ